MPGHMRRKTYEFTPVILIAEQHRNPADLAAIEHIHRLHAEVMSTMDTERSRKTTIGISEIGSECRKCVARKLSGLYPKRQEGGAGWRAQVGTMGHAYLEQHILEKYPWMFEWYEEDDPARPGKVLWKYRTREDVEPTVDQPIYYLERRLQVWEYKGVSIERDDPFVLDGSCDLFSKVKIGAKHFTGPSTPGDVQLGDVIGVVTDWKFQGQRKLAETAKGKIGDTYTVQMSTYGLGYELAGLTPTHLDLHALPRDGDLDESRPVLMRYDRQVAIDALARIKGMIDAAPLMGGWPQFIATQPIAPGCFDCDFFESIEEGDFIQSLTA